MPPKPVAEKIVGLPCPACGDVRNGVTNSHLARLGTVAAIRRYRKCVACGHNWKTYEIPEEVAAALSSRGARGELRRALAALETIRKTLAAYERGATREEEPRD